MSDLQNFLFEGQDVRFVGTSEVPEWVSADILSILYPEADKRNYSNYLATVPEKWKGHKQVMTLGGFQDMVTLFEPGLYRLINRSDSPFALPFQEWLYEEVLPSIRKTGSYSVQGQTPTQAFFPVLQERRDRLEIIQLGMDLLSQLGGIDERTEVQLKDLVRSIVLADKLKSTALPGATDRLEWTLSDRVIHLGYKPQNNKILMRIGRAAATLYRARYGKDENGKYIEPPKKEQFVDGATRMVNLYDSENVDILDVAIKQILGDLP
jgi:prophage antirepressor-like protein